MIIIIITDVIIISIIIVVIISSSFLTLLNLLYTFGHSILYLFINKIFLVYFKYERFLNIVQSWQQTHQDYIGDSVLVFLMKTLKSICLIYSSDDLLLK